MPRRWVSCFKRRSFEHKELVGAGGQAADATTAALREFCDRIRLLHREAGGPTVDSLAADPSIPLRRSQLYDLLAGRIRRPPDWTVVSSIVNACVRYSASRGRTGLLATDLDDWRREHLALVSLCDAARQSAPNPDLTHDHPANTALRESDAVIVQHQEVVTFRLHQADGRGAAHVGYITGDVRHVRCADVWVNSENTDMAMARPTEFSFSAVVRYLGSVRDADGAVVDDIVYRDLERQVGARRPVPPGTALVTSSGELRHTHGVACIVHVAAVEGAPGAGFRPVADLASCVRSALRAAETTHETPPAARVLFPLLGTGMGGAPVQPTAETLLNAAAEYLCASDPHARIRTIYFLAYTPQERDACATVLAAMPGAMRD